MKQILSYQLTTTPKTMQVKKDKLIEESIEKNEKITQFCHETRFLDKVLVA